MERYIPPEDDQDEDSLEMGSVGVQLPAEPAEEGEVLSYIQDMLARYGAKMPAAAPAEGASSKSPYSAPAPVIEMPAAAPAEPAERKRVAAPETQADLEALRQVANASARNAINSYDVDRRFTSAWLLFTKAGAATFLAGSLWAWSVWGSRPWALAAGLGVWLIAAFWTRKFRRTAQQMQHA